MLNLFVINAAAHKLHTVDHQEILAQDAGTFIAVQSTGQHVVIAIIVFVVFSILTSACCCATEPQPLIDPNLTKSKRRDLLTTERESAVKQKLERKLHHLDAALHLQQYIEKEVQDKPPITREEFLMATMTTEVATAHPVTSATNPQAEILQAVTHANVAQGLHVVRGRSWDYGDQDHGQVGIVTMCVQAPDWWMVQWFSGPPHAYFVGHTSQHQCDLALALPKT